MQVRPQFQPRPDTVRGDLGVLETEDAVEAGRALCGDRVDHLLLPGSRVCHGLTLGGASSARPEDRPCAISGPDSGSSPMPDARWCGTVES
ncbi:hypothetical protein GCM10027289_28420 [Tsukamurella serpentis]